MNRALRSVYEASWRAACVVVLLAGVPACGLKGPLYLPDRPVEVIPADTSATPSREQEKKERSGTAQNRTSTGNTPPKTTPDR